MNFGTKLRTALFIISILNQANVSLGVWEFGNETVNLVYKVFSYILTLLAGAAALWYNNDFTEVANKYTIAMREEKARQKSEDEEDGEDLEDGEHLDDIDEEGEE